MLLNIKYPCYGHQDLKAAILLYTNSQFSRVDISNSKAPKILNFAAASGGGRCLVGLLKIY